MADLDELHDAPPTVTSADAIDTIVAASKRPQAFPLRREFLQQRADDQIVPGPLADLVSAGDQRALLLLLMLITKASAAPWNAALPATAWARALGVELPDSKSAGSAISKVWLRLANRKLVSRSRHRRLADVTLLREDGSGEPYDAPGRVGEPYFKVPLGLWTMGPEGNDKRWYQVLTLPELAIVLIGRSLGDEFRLPFESGPAWYGISADSVSRGVAGLAKHGLLTIDKRFKKAPLSAVGYTAEHLYTLQGPFGPVGHRSGSSKPKVGRRLTRP